MTSRPASGLPAARGGGALAGLPAVSGGGALAGVGAREAGKGEGAEQQAEVAQGDVAVPADEKQADDDAREPSGHEQPAEARSDQHDEAGGDLDDSDDVHAVLS